MDAGLARLRGGQAADFFASRIVFPIADGQGRVQGFGGPHPRPGRPGEVRQLARGAELPQADPALRARRGPRTAAAKKGFFVVAEGYTDVMGLVASGVEAAVACMGTSLTSEQLRLLRR